MVRFVVRSSLALMALAGSALAADQSANLIAESNHRASAAIEADPSLSDQGSVLVSVEHAPGGGGGPGGFGGGGGLAAGRRRGAASRGRWCRGWCS